MIISSSNCNDIGSAEFQNIAEIGVQKNVPLCAGESEKTMPLAKVAGRQHGSKFRYP
jgi:hypothetical protein